MTVQFSSCLDGLLLSGPRLRASKIGYIRWDRAATFFTSESVAHAMRESVRRDVIEPVKKARDYRRYAASLREIAMRGGPLRDKADALAIEYELLADSTEAAERSSESDSDSN